MVTRHRLNVELDIRDLSTEQVSALLYIAGRFMMVRIDRCGRRLEAASNKVRDRGAWIKYRAALRVGRDQDERMFRMLDMEGYLVWRKCHFITFCYF